MNRHNSLTKLTLLTLEKSVDGYMRFEDFVRNSYIYAQGYDRPIKKSSFAQALKRVREKGWVELIDDQTITFKLTDKGKEQALLLSLELADDEWDGKWRIVIFDIPEKRKVLRNLLRNKLKAWGFTPWQKSVWVSKKNCTHALREFIKQASISEWVMVIESNDVDI